MSLATATVELFNKIVDALKTETKEGVEPVVEHDKSRLHALPQLGGKYTLRLTPVSMGKGYWSYTVVEILDTATGVTLGHYQRSYHCFYDTFFPFRQGGKEYALYSKDYTATRVMSLPDCTDVAGEEGHGFGFCPTGFYVPQPEDAIARGWDDEPNPALDGTFGFVCGCVWGDDSSWKIRYLDLSKITAGVFKNEDRFGYLELDDADKLADAIDLRHYEGPDSPSVGIRTRLSFNLTRSVKIDWSHLTYSAYEKQADAEDPERVQKCATEGCGHAGKNHRRKSTGECYIYKCTCKAFQSSGVVDPDEVESD